MNNTQELFNLQTQQRTLFVEPIDRGLVERIVICHQQRSQKDDRRIHTQRQARKQQLLQRRQQ